MSLILPYPSSMNRHRHHHPLSSLHQWFHQWFHHPLSPSLLKPSSPTALPFYNLRAVLFSVVVEELRRTQYRSPKCGRRCFLHRASVTIHDHALLDRRQRCYLRPCHSLPEVRSTLGRTTDEDKAHVPAPASVQLLRHPVSYASFSLQPILECVGVSRPLLPWTTPFFVVAIQWKWMKHASLFFL